MAPREATFAVARTAVALAARLVVAGAALLVFAAAVPAATVWTLLAAPLRATALWAAVFFTGALVAAAERALSFALPTALADVLTGAFAVARPVVAVFRATDFAAVFLLCVVLVRCVVADFFVTLRPGPRAFVAAFAGALRAAVFFTLPAVFFTTAFPAGERRAAVPFDEAVLAGVFFFAAAGRAAFTFAALAGAFTRTEAPREMVLVLREVAVFDAMIILSSKKIAGAAPSSRGAAET